MFPESDAGSFWILIARGALTTVYERVGTVKTGISRVGVFRVVYGQSKEIDSPMFGIKPIFSIFGALSYGRSADVSTNFGVNSS